MDVVTPEIVVLVQNCFHEMSNDIIKESVNVDFLVPKMAFSSHFCDVVQNKFEEDLLESSHLKKIGISMSMDFLV
jgi:hypothetical protein